MADRYDAEADVLESTQAQTEPQRQLHGQNR
jgi:hypothetical protein